LPHAGRSDAKSFGEPFFDGAWQAIAVRHDITTADPPRERLAKIVLALMPDTKDPTEIQPIAVQEMTKGK
jgi:hypothetical protein